MCISSDLCERYLEFKVWICSFCVCLYKVHFRIIPKYLVFWWACRSNFWVLSKLVKHLRKIFFRDLFLGSHHMWEHITGLDWVLTDVKYYVSLPFRSLRFLIVQGFALWCGIRYNLHFIKLWLMYVSKDSRFLWRVLWFGIRGFWIHL